MAPSSHLELIESELRKIQIELPVSEKATLSRYCDELIRWNQKVNLTGLQGADMVRRLVVEPVWVARQLCLSGVLVDIGSGNGSPAIPMHVVSKLEQCHLVEARTKRSVFLRHAVGLLKMSNVTVHRARFENVAPKLGRADWVTLQAVRLTPELLDSISKICTQTTTVVWITSSSAKLTVAPTKVLEVPLSNTKVFLFHLDLF